MIFRKKEKSRYYLDMILRGREKLINFHTPNFILFF